MSETRLRLQKLIVLSCTPFALIYIVFWTYSTQVISSRMNEAISTEPYPIQNVSASDCVNTLYQTPVFLKPFPNYPNLPMMDSANKLIFCWIPKNACTQFKALFCHRFSNYTGGGGSTNGEMIYIHNICFRKIPVFRPANHGEVLYQDPSWEKWAVIRDPIDRMVSAWLDKCRGLSLVKNQDNCYGCVHNLGCFIRKNHDHIREMSLGLRIPTTLKMDYQDHFYPQYWFCGFNGLLDKYSRIFKYQKSKEFQEIIRDAFRDRGWDQAMIYSGWGRSKKDPFLGDSTIHSVNGSNSADRKNFAFETIRTSLELTELLYRTYRIDYVSFNITKPAWSANLCANAAVSVRKSMIVCTDGVP